MGEKTEKFRRRTLSIAIALGILFSFLFAALLLNLINGNSVTCGFDRDFSEVRTLVTACTAYAKDSNDQFPASLKALYPEYIDVDAAFYERDSGKPYLYRSGLRLSDSPNEPLILGPPDENGNRIIGYVGGHVVESGTVPPEILAEFE